MARHFAFTRPDGSSVRAQHYQARRPDDSHKRFAASRDADELPPKVDLRPYMTAVEDQQQTSSCVANATAGAYEYLVKRHADEPYDVSRLFIYYNGRDLEGSADEDSGMCIEDAVKGLRTYGACSEDTWPFDEGMVNDKPSDNAYEEAGAFLVEDVQVVPTELGDWKQALADGYPIIFGISLFKSFDKQRKPGLVPLPTPSESSRASHGGHAMLCVGYSDPDEVFIVRNSWGTEWGDEGYCYIPYDYLMNPEYNDGDSWIIRQLQAVPDGSEATWSHDEESVLEEIEGEIADMTDEEFHGLLDACGEDHFETRVAVLFLVAAGADGDIDASEVTEIATYLQHVLDALGVRGDAEAILQKAAERAEQALVESTLRIFDEHLSTEALAGMIQHIRSVVDADGTSDDEHGFIDALVQAWQVGDGDSAQESEQDDADEDDSGEDDSDEDSSEGDSDEDASEGDSDEDASEDDSDEDSSEEDSDEDSSEEESEEGN